MSETATSDIGSAGAPVPAGANGADAGGSGPAQETTEQAPKGPNWQSRYDTLQSRLGPLAPRLDRMSGEQIELALSTLEKALAHEKLGPQLVALSTGRPIETTPTAPAAPTQDPFEFETEAVRTLAQEVQALKSQLEGVQHSSVASAFTQAKERMMGALSRFEGEFPELSDEERAAFRQTVQQQTGTMLSKDPVSFLQVDDATWKGVWLGMLDKHVPLKTLALRALQKQQSEVATRATDPGLRTTTTGREGPATPAKGQRMSRRQIEEEARRAWNEISRDLGVPVK